MKQSQPLQWFSFQSSSVAALSPFCLIDCHRVVSQIIRRGSLGSKESHNFFYRKKDFFWGGGWYFLKIEGVAKCGSFMYMYHLCHLTRVMQATKFNCGFCLCASLNQCCHGGECSCMPMADHRRAQDMCSTELSLVSHSLWKSLLLGVTPTSLTASSSV